MRLVEAEYEEGVLRPSTHLALCPGERVYVIVLRKPDGNRWDLARFAKSSAAEDAALTDQGLEDWAAQLSQEDLR